MNAERQELVRSARNASRLYREQANISGGWTVSGQKRIIGSLCSIIDGLCNELDAANSSDGGEERHVSGDLHSCF